MEWPARSPELNISHFFRELESIQKYVFWDSCLLYAVPCTFSNNHKRQYTEDRKIEGRHEYFKKVC